MTDDAPHLVLVAPHYPPSTAAGARRPANLVRTFRRAGWRVSVVTCGDGEQTWHEGTSGERVRCVPVPEQYRRASRLAPASGARTGGTSRRRGRLHRQLVAMRAFPDLWRDAEGPLAAAALEAVGDGRDTLLYSTAPPITSHQAACRVATRSAVRWVAEHRDPWTEPGSQRTRWAGTVMYPAAALLLRRLLRRADLHVAVTGGVGDWLRERGARAVLTSLNGIPDELLGMPGRGMDLGTIRYVGEFYLGRDPAPLFAALGRLRAASHLPSACRLELIGDVTSALGQPTEALLARHGLADIASLTGRLPHDEALARIRSAGLLVLLAQGQPLQIPNKVFEYLGAARPILAVVDHGGETHRLLQATGSDQFVLTEHSAPDEWDHVVASATAAVVDPAPIHHDPQAVAALTSTTQLGLVERACRRLLEEPWL